MSVAVVGGTLSSVTPVGAATATVSVIGTQSWTDTGLAVTEGDYVSVDASGAIDIGNSSVANGGIEPPYGADCGEIGSGSFPLPTAPCWSMIGRIGAGPTFLVGSSASFTASTSGHLYLGPNDNYLADNVGDWTAHVFVGSVLTITAGVDPAPVPSFSPSGVSVGFAIPTASDGHGTVPVTCDRIPGDVFPIGQTTVTCSAEDADGIPPNVETTLSVTVTDTTPGAPTIGTATAGDGSISVAFTAGRTGSSDTLGFGASCSSLSSGIDGTASGSGSPIVVAGLTNGKSYTCSVHASNKTGNSAQSGASNTVVPGGTTVEGTCTNVTECNATLPTPKTPFAPAQTATVTGTSTDEVGSVQLSTGSGSLGCPNSAQVVTPVSILTTTGFSSATNLTVTVTQLAVASGPGKICFSKNQPFLSESNPTIPKPGSAVLLQCSAVANLAPCQISSTQSATAITVTFLVPGGDPKFRLVLPLQARLFWPSTFPVGKVGAVYGARFHASGGKAPFHWKVKSGKLAPGLKLDASTGAISGKPTAKGVFKSVVQATDSQSPPKAANIAVALTIK